MDTLGALRKSLPDGVTVDYFEGAKEEFIYYLFTEGNYEQRIGIQGNPSVVTKESVAHIIEYVMSTFNEIRNT